MFAGAVVSMRTVHSCDQPELKPALSNTRVLTVWMPLALIVTLAGLEVDMIGVVAPSISHSTCSIFEVASLPVTATVTGAVCQPADTCVASVGMRVSISTCCVFHGVHVPEPSV